MHWALLISILTADVPSSIKPPDTARLVMRAAADGVQIYACEAVKDSYAWVFKAPEAALFDEKGRQIGKHSAGPTWESFDGSQVRGELVMKTPSPSPDAIPWLLLRATSHGGVGPLSKVSHVQRIETKGGVAPSSGCDSAHVGAEARMRYSADYLFYSEAP